MADLSQDVTAQVKGSYATMVVLSDGSIKSIGEYYANPGALTIDRPLQGAYSSRAKTATGIVATSTELKADNNGDFDGEVPGAYNDRVVVDGQVVSLVDKLEADGKAGGVQLTAGPAVQPRQILKNPFNT